MIPLTGLPPVTMLTPEKMGLTLVSLAVNVTAIAPPMFQMLQLRRHARTSKSTSLPMTESPRFYKENTPVPTMVMSTPWTTAATMPTS